MPSLTRWKKGTRGPKGLNGRKPLAGDYQRLNGSSSSIASTTSTTSTNSTSTKGGYTVRRGSNAPDLPPPPYKERASLDSQRPLLSQPQQQAKSTPKRAGSKEHVYPPVPIPNRPGHNPNAQVIAPRSSAKPGEQVDYMGYALNNPHKLIQGHGTQPDVPPPMTRNARGVSVMPKSTAPKMPPQQRTPADDTADFPIRYVAPQPKPVPFLERPELRRTTGPRKKHVRDAPTGPVINRADQTDMENKLDDEFRAAIQRDRERDAGKETPENSFRKRQQQMRKLGDLTHAQKTLGNNHVVEMSQPRLFSTGFFGAD